MASQRIDIANLRYFGVGLREENPWNIEKIFNQTPPRSANVKAWSFKENTQAN